MKIVQDEWAGCYPSSWKGLIVPDAIKHPAKFSSKLIARIYQHMKDEGWIKPGDVILDPFGGVALGALDAMRLGLRWRGVELELRFAQLGNENIALWNKKFSRMPNWCQDSVLLQGDSRKLLEVVQVANQAVSSPPYSGSDPSASHVQGLSRTDPNSPNYRPFAVRSIEEGYNETRKYGHTDGQLGAMPEGDFSGAVSSPPYADSMERKGGFDPELSKHNKGGPNSNISNFDTGYSDVAGSVSSPPYSEARIGQESGQEQCGHGDQYGATPGQLGAMKADGFDAAISSPPYNKPFSQDHPGTRGGTRGIMPSEEGAFVRYGNTDGQLEGLPDGDFDSAISSPPFLQARGGTPEPKADGAIDAALYQRHSAGNASAHGYGESEGQLSSMQDGQFDQAVSSPPMMDSTAGRGSDELTKSKGLGNDYDSRIPYEKRGFLMTPEEREEYINSCNLGSFRAGVGDSFWLSARQIVDQVYLALRPGGHAVWVVKAFVKNKQVVDFPGQWQQLCEAAGFRTVHIHHALLTNHRGSSYTLDGGSVEHKTEAKSFFRRNGENKARAARWWETSDLSRACKADWLWAAHDLKWRQYHQDLEKNPGRKIKQPKAFIVLGKAQSMAYEAAGSPDIQIDTSIDYEVVLCMVKAEEA